MTIKHTYRPLTAVLLAGALAAIAPVSGRAQVNGLPNKRGPITLVGCFEQEVKTKDAGVLKQRTKKDTDYMLANSKMGSVTSVTEATCASTGQKQPVELKDIHEVLEHMNASLVGRWVEITGTLDRAEDVDKPNEVHLRAVHVKSIRAIPVSRIAYIAPKPEPPAAPEVQPAPEPAPAAPAEEVVTTTAVVELPKTASSLPLTGLLGLFALVGGLAVRSVGTSPCPGARMTQLHDPAARTAAGSIGPARASACRARGRYRCCWFPL